MQNDEDFLLEVLSVSNHRLYHFKDSYKLSKEYILNSSIKDTPEDAYGRLMLEAFGLDVDLDD
eukprot:gene3762-6650_t